MASERRQDRRLKKLATKAHKMTPARKAALEKAVKASALKRKAKGEKKVARKNKKIEKLTRKQERISRRISRAKSGAATSAGRAQRATARLAKVSGDK